MLSRAVALALASLLAYGLPAADLTPGADAQAVNESAARFDVLPPVEALHAAVRAGNLDEVKRLVLSGVDPNGRDALGSTPVLDAAWSGNTSILTFLISRGADVNAAHREAGSTPLFYAVLTGHTEAVKLLLAAGARVNTKTRGGQTVLHLASARGNAAIAQALLAAHGDAAALDDADKTPLDEAVMHDQLATMSLLLAQGADVRHVHAESGRGAMAEACIKGYADLIGPLVQSGASLTAADRYGETPLDLALAYKNAQAVKELLRLGLHLSESEAAAENAMEAATLRGQVDIARTLVEGGFDVTRPTPAGSSYLHDAALKGQAKMARFLLEHGASVRAVNGSGATPLHDAALGGSPEVIQLLLEHGAELNARDKDTGATPLMLAASMGRSLAVAALIDHGANARLRDRDGHTALDRAREMSDPETIHLLEAARANAGTRSPASQNSPPASLNFDPKI